MQGGVGTISADFMGATYLLRKVHLQIINVLIRINEYILLPLKRQVVSLACPLWREHISAFFINVI